MVEYYPQPAAGQPITADLLRSMLPRTARKTSDTQRAATTTATADPHLQFDVEANAVYAWWGWLKYSSPTAADINIDFSAPSGSLGEWVGFGPGITRIVSLTDAASPVAQSDVVESAGYLTRMETTDVTAARGYGGLGTGTPLGIDLKGTLRVGSNAGTWSVDWAQRVSDAANTTIYTDSWIVMIRVA